MLTIAIVLILIAISFELMGFRTAMKDRFFRWMMAGFLTQTALIVAALAFLR
jgi:uncharacterized membrane protein